MSVTICYAPGIKGQAEGWRNRHGSAEPEFTLDNLFPVRSHGAMDKPRVAVTLEEYEAHLIVALRTLPRHVWERYVKWEKKRLDKRDTESDRIDPPVEIAKHVATKLEKAKWTITREQHGNLFG